MLWNWLGVTKNIENFLTRPVYSHEISYNNLQIHVLETLSSSALLSEFFSVMSGKVEAECYILRFTTACLLSLSPPSLKHTTPV